LINGSNSAITAEGTAISRNIGGLFL
jgi:hypothetical protein